MTESVRKGSADRSRPALGPNRREFLALASLSGAALLMSVDCAGWRRAQPFEPNLWITIHPDDRVELRTTRLEMGQGIRTTLALLAAEELALAPQKIDLHTPSTSELPEGEAEMLATGGSRSTATLWRPLRLAAAAAREMLTTAAARRWAVEAAECEAIDGAIVHPASGRRFRYGELVRDAAALPVPDAPRLRALDELRHVGRPTRRLEGPAVVTGQPRYACDHRLDGLRFAVLARPPVPGARRRDYDATETLATPGVRRVVELGESLAVVADDTWSALRGREALRVEWDEGANAGFSSAGFAAALEAGLELPVRARYRSWLPGGSAVVVAANGELPERAHDAPPAIDALFSTPFQAHAPMEPFNATARFARGRCEIWVGHQSPHRVIEEVSERLGVPLHDVVVHPFAMGGGFGAREHAGFAIEAAALAQQLDGVPVQLFWSRDDDLRHGALHPASLHRVRVWLGRDGRLAGWLHRVVSPAVEKQWGLRPSAVPYAEASGAWNIPYAVPSLRVEYADPPQPLALGFWRGIGINQNAMVVECVVDEAARLAGRDPVEYRLEHLGETVHSLGSEAPYPLARLRPTVELAAARGDWGAPLPAGRGRGFASLVFDGRTSVATVAEVTVVGDSFTVDRLVCALDCGLVVNPLGLAGNTESALTWGLSALFSEITLGRGRVEQSSHLDYPILRLPQMPAVEVHTVPSHEPPSGVGEVASPTVAPAVLNALHAATGRRLRRLPIRPGDLA